MLVLLHHTSTGQHNHNAGNEKESPLHTNEKGPSFDVQKFRTTKGVTLTWKPPVQSNAVTYTVETGSDGIEFYNPVAVQKNKQKVFSFTSNQIHNHNTYYRITLESADFKLQEIVFVEGTDVKPYAIYTSPSGGDVFADLFRDFKGHTMRVIVRDDSGKIRLSKEIPIGDKHEKIKLIGNRESPGAGTYLVSLAFKQKTFSETVVFK
jgi:hypothetical protein